MIMIMIMITATTPPTTPPTIAPVLSSPMFVNIIWVLLCAYVVHIKLNSLPM